MVKNILIAVLVLCLGIALAKWFSLRVRLAFGEEQTQYFEEMVIKGTSTASPGEVDSLIEGVQKYYPSGSKQSPGTHTDLMVERARRLAIQQLELRKVQILTNHNK